VKRWRVAPGSFAAYAGAVLLVAAAAALRLGLEFFASQLQAFTTFYPAVLFAALIGGAGPGVIAALLSAAVCWVYFLPPYTSLFPLSVADEINLLTFLVASLLVVWATDHYRRLTKRLKDEERFRILAVDELTHRLKNKVATIQSIVAFRLREQPQVKDEIARSLAALMATDDLISASQGKGAHIRAILSAELTPYDLSRISLNGPDRLLPAKLALTMALLLHELATNAAKYGSLSRSSGRLVVEWSLGEANRLSLVWRESDGPPVRPPNHRGFGTRLFERALAQFDGSVSADFAPTGFVCSLSVAIPEEGPDDVAMTSDGGREVYSTE